MKTMDKRFDRLTTRCGKTPRGDWGGSDSRFLPPPGCQCLRAGDRGTILACGGRGRAGTAQTATEQSDHKTGPPGSSTTGSGTS